ncbi:MAG TPA: hypothetical protein VM261_26270 [Kofleriaceae bacterium]|nr:hypothetical protein [Kofleriaceae bacterium]
MRTISVLLAALLALPACAVDDGLETGETELPAGDDEGKADGTTELTVRAGETTLWVDRAILRDTREGADGLVLRGRTSRNLTDGFAFVFDDPYGAFAIRSARTFEVRWTTSELASLLVGVDQFVRLHFVHSSSRPDALAARVVARLRTTAFSGTGAYLFTEVAPVMSGGRTVMRVQGSSTSDLLEVTAAVGATTIDGVAITDPRHFQIDLPVDTAITLAGSAAADLAVTTRTAAGTRTKRGKLALEVKKLGMTTGDPYEVWPRPEVTGVTATRADGNAAIAAAEPALIALRADGVGLVGAARTDALVAGARRILESRVTALVGTSYPDAAQRDAALAAAVTAAIDDAYAFPLAHVPTLAPMAGNTARHRELAADALLAHLAGLDLVHTELGRSYVELCRQFRARHVASIRSFRLEVAPEESATAYIYIGNWLDPYVEVSVARDTGVATSVYFEID